MARTLLLAATLAAAALLNCSSSDELEDDQGPRVVEGRAGSLVITAPARGAFVEGEGGAIEVRGRGATNRLEINGELVRVEDDGTFAATLRPSVGLNLVVATDGAARLERPFLYGKFVAPDAPVANAIAIDVGTRGLSAPYPAASVSSVANLALSGRNLVGAIAGKSFSGSTTAADWTFTATSGQNGPANADLTPITGGLGLRASVRDVVVDGRLTLTSLGLTYARDVRITVATAEVAGDLAVDLDDAGAFRVAMPNAAAKIEGFRFDTDNAGFPCCVDTILTSFVAPKVQEAVQNGVRDQLPGVVGLSLDGLGLPKEIDYAAAGVAVKFPMTSRFDGAWFDPQGLVVSAAAHFGGSAAPGTPGAGAPGWLPLGGAFDRPQTHAPFLGVSFAVDAVNQLLYAAWSSGSLAFTAPPPLGAKLAPALPPMLSITPEGALRIALAEILVQRGDAKPLAAVSVMQDVVAKTDADALLFAPQGRATISITWLTDDREGSGKDTIAGAAKDQLEKFLTPLRVPIPKLALDALGGGFAGQSLAFGQPTVSFDRRSNRILASGSFSFASAPAR